MTVFDPRPDLADVVDQIRTESGVGDPRLVRMADSLADAVADADLIQENGPERSEVKQELFADIAAAAPDHAVFATSSSAIGPEPRKVDTGFGPVLRDRLYSSQNAVTAPRGAASGHRLIASRILGSMGS